MRRLLVLIFVCVSAAAVAGCSDTSLVGKRVDNFTAYYNTFYNARESFEKGYERVEDQQAAEQVDLNRYLALFPEGQSGTVREFETAIEKSADVLREHPNSKWVDESLMLIGKSYYFQQNYIGAEQKFREVRGMATELEPEARFWLVRTLVASGRLGEAERVSTAVLADEGAEPDTWTARTWLARGSAFVRQARWSDAAQAISTGLSGDLPRALRARAAFLLGQVRETLGDPSGAQTAYERAENAANEYELVYAARLSAIRVQGLNGAPEEALDRLESMEADDKNFERIGALRVLRARLLNAEGEPDRARGVLRDVLYDEPPTQGVTRGRAHHAMGSIYRDAYDDFSRAAAHFDTASTSLEQTITTREPVLLTPVAITNSESLSRRYRILAERAADVARMDSLLDLGALPPEELRARLQEIQEAEAQRRAAEQERRNEQATARRFNARTVTTDRNRSRQTNAAASGGSFLFHENPTRVQEGRRMFERRWGPRPRVDNWRRSAVIEQQQRQQAEDPDARTDGDADAPARADATNNPEELRETGLDVGEIPQTADERRAMKAERAVARYELATALFLNAERPDSAATWYRRIVEEDADEPVARRALYALAEVHTAEGRPDEARELYRRVIDEAPASVFAQRARQRLGRAPIDVPDTTAMAEADYAVAFRAWQSGRLDSARAAMARVAQQHDSSAVAPRAVLALASIGIDELRDGSARAPDSSLVRFLQSVDAGDALVEDGRGRLRDALGQDAPVEPAPNSQVPRRPPANASGDGNGEQNRPSRRQQPQGLRQTPSRQTAEEPPSRRGRAPDSLRQSAQSIRQPGRADTARAASSRRSLVPRRPGEAPRRDERAIAAPAAYANSASSPDPSAEPPSAEPPPGDMPRANNQASPEDGSPDGGRPDDGPDEVDGAGGEAATEPAVPDSVSQAYRPVVNVLAYLVARYPESPEAERATTMGAELARRYDLLAPEPPAADQPAADPPAQRSPDAREDAPEESLDGSAREAGRAPSNEGPPDARGEAQGEGRQAGNGRLPMRQREAAVPPADTTMTAPQPTPPSRREREQPDSASIERPVADSTRIQPEPGPASDGSRN